LLIIYLFLLLVLNCLLISLPLAQVGDRVGVKRLSNGSLVFSINGVEQGVAAANLPDQLYAVVDVYGQCSQVKLTTATQGTVIIIIAKILARQKILPRLQLTTFCIIEIFCTYDIVHVYACTCTCSAVFFQTCSNLIQFSTVVHVD
jgi:hypothetical protein